MPGGMIEHLAVVFALITCLIPPPGLARSDSGIGALLKSVQSAYEKVADYQANVEVKIYEKDGSAQVQAFLYRFKKPNRIRLDFESPHPGMVMVYPDSNGKVVVRPFPRLPLFKLRLSPDSALLRNPFGQRIDQTDMGLLIRNIGRSLTDRRRGLLDVEEKNGTIEFRVLAEDHFKEGVLTLYRFTIDRNLWLPIRVEESDPEGTPGRIVTFRDLRTNISIPDRLFDFKE
jgi:outer membrane lipoprotein-sorting protein